MSLLLRLISLPTPELHHQRDERRCDCEPWPFTWGPPAPIVGTLPIGARDLTRDRNDVLGPDR